MGLDPSIIGQKRKRKAFVRPRYPSPVSNAAIDVTVTLQLRVVNELNNLKHWRVVGRRRKHHRDCAGRAVAFAPGFARPASTDSRHVVTLTRIIGKRGRDLDRDDNLPASMKSIRDGVADAMEIDDGGNRVEWKYEQRRGADWGVEIHIRSVA